MIYPGDLCITLRNIPLFKNKRMLYQHSDIMIPGIMFVVIAVEDMFFQSHLFYSLNIIIIQNNEFKIRWIFEKKTHIERIC